MNSAGTLVLLAFMAAASHPVEAQQSLDYGSVGGRVSDQSGSAIEGAQVTARQVQTNVSSATLTGSDGRFRFAYLRVGRYDVTIRHPGFADAFRSLDLAAGSAFELPVALAVRGVDARVVVSGGPAAIDAARSQIAGTVPEAEIRTLPLNGRNFLDVAMMVPGVSPANTGPTQLFPETSAVPGASLSVGSQRNLSNNFIVDGLSANDDAAALSGITYAVDAIEQFQVVTSGGQAELGRALGGYVNVVTKSGTNAVRADVYAYGRHDRFSARNPLSGLKLPMRQLHYGASLGGPFAPDRTFYFANVERRSLDQSGIVTISPVNVSLINARLAATGYPGPLVSTGPYSTSLRSTNVLGKVNHQAGRNQLAVRYAFYEVSAERSRGAGGLNAPSAAAGLQNRDHSVGIGNTLMLSARTVLETRAQFAHGDLAAPPADTTGPAVAIAGVASFGTLSGNPTGRVNALYQIVNNLSHHAGAHAVRAGVDLLYNDDRITFPRAVRGSYTFSSMGSFLAGAYNNAGFTQTFGATGVTQRNPNVGLYVQDEWKPTSQITLNLGLRYDLQFLETIDTDRTNLAPRAGVAWVPFAARRTIVRGSTGLFYDRVPLRPLANALLSAGNTTDVARLRQIGVSLSPGQAEAPMFPAILKQAVPPVTLANLTTMDRHLQNAHSRQASVELEQQLGGSLTASAGYQYVRGRQLLLSINQNVPACQAAGSNNGCRPQSAYANNSQYSSAGSSSSQALHLSLLQRPSRRGQYRVSYVLSKSMNNVSEFFFSSPIDPFDLSKDWGRSDNDQRHRVIVSGSLTASRGPARTLLGRILRGSQVGGMLQAYSALPLNIASGVTTLQGTAGRPRVDGRFIARNAGTGSDFLSLNVRGSRTIGMRRGVGVEVIVEGFNLTNRRNISGRNATFGTGAYPTEPSAGFGQVTAVGEPRAFQLGARVRF